MDVYKTKYTTTQGETWDMISEKLYGTPHRVAELISVNADHSDTLIFDEDIELSIPVLEEHKSNTLAPWKRGA